MRESLSTSGGQKESHRKGPPLHHELTSSGSLRVQAEAEERRYGGTGCLVQPLWALPV